MSQHYSVSWKKGLAALCLLAVAGLSGCDQKENAAAKVEYDGLSNSQPLRVDANNHTVTIKDCTAVVRQHQRDRIEQTGYFGQLARGGKSVFLR